MNGEQVAQGRVDKTQGFCFSADEGADVGCDLGTAVADSYSVPFKFSGKIDKVTAEFKAPTAQEKADSDNAHKEGALKKALSD